MMGPQYGEPIENLAIGKIIEVDGSRVIAELDADLTELSRIYAGEVYPIGQFGSIVRVHFGRRLIYAFVGRLRMKSEYEVERGMLPSSSGDERIIEADLFGEGEWKPSNDGHGPTLEFERGVATYPLPQQTLYLTPKSDMRFIYGHADGASVQLGEHVGSGGAPCYAHLNELLGKHTAILGSTGPGNLPQWPPCCTASWTEAKTLAVRPGIPESSSLTPTTNTVRHFPPILAYQLKTERSGCPTGCSISRRPWLC